MEHIQCVITRITCQWYPCLVTETARFMSKGDELYDLMNILRVILHPPHSHFLWTSTGCFIIYMTVVQVASPAFHVYSMLFIRYKCNDFKNIYELQTKLILVFLQDMRIHSTELLNFRNRYSDAVVYYSIWMNLVAPLTVYQRKRCKEVRYDDGKKL